MSDNLVQVDPGAAPANIKGWNWGAFLLSWVWGLGNKTYIALLALIPGVNVVMAFVLGAKGNQWAWQNRPWVSEDQFWHVQKLWSAFGWGMLAGFLLGAVGILLVVAHVVTSVFF